MVNLTGHACRYKVHKLHQRDILYVHAYKGVGGGVGGDQ